MRPPRVFHHKFLDAIRGVRAALPGQSSFVIHAVATALVVLAGWYLRIPRGEWALLVLCITLVWSAELFNSALESMAAAIDTDYNPDIGKALDVSSAAVLLVALGAAVVGTIVLGYRFGIYWNWWTAHDLASLIPPAVLLG